MKNLKEKTYHPFIDDNDIWYCQDQINGKANPYGCIVIAKNFSEIIDAIMKRMRIHNEDIEEVTLKKVSPPMRLANSDEYIYPNVWIMVPKLTERYREKKKKHILDWPRVRLLTNRII